MYSSSANKNNSNLSAVFVSGAVGVGGVCHTFLKTYSRVTRAHKTADISVVHPCKTEMDANQKTWHTLCRNAAVSETQ